MTKQQINSHFVSIYSELETYTKKAIKSLRSPIDPYAALSECFIYVDMNCDKIDSTQTLTAYSKTFIKNNIKWRTSPLNRKETQRPGHVEFIEDFGRSHTDARTQIIYDESIKAFNKFLNTYEKRLFDLYIIRNIRTGKAIANQLDVSITCGYSLLHECKEIEERFKNYIINSI